MSENWRPAPGYEGAYEVSDQGRVRTIDRFDARGRRRTARILRLRESPNGRLAVALYADRIRTNWPVHVLVLTAFVGPRPEGMECCHWNDKPDDNRLDNLRWDTRSANQLDSVRNGTHHVAIRSACPKGHAYTPENTYLHPRGSRVCRECRRLYREEHREERRAKGREYMRIRRASGKVA